MLILLKVFCRLLAALPVGVVSLLCRFMALLLALFMADRRRTTMRSLHHAFPDRTEAWRRGVFRQSCARMFEMGLFRSTASYFSSQRLDEVLEIPDTATALMTQYAPGQAKYGKPFVVLMPHMTMAEAATLLPRHFPEFPQLNAIFRPLNQPKINAWVMAERERYGVKLLSRKNGYNQAMAALRNGEAVGLLFDQDASKKGTTITFMDRIISATDLPGLMAHRFQADVFLMLTERTGFWKAKLTLQEIPLGASPTEISVRAHDALAAYLRRDANSAADWLWLHDRWNHYYSRHKRFRLPQKRNQLELSNRIHGYATLPRQTRLWVRLPNWLGDVVMALPILRAIRAARPDFEMTLIGKAAFQPLVERLGVADHFVPLPERGRGYFKTFYAKRREYPDTYLLLTNSFRGDLEAWLTRCQQRIGMVRPGKRRPLLTDPYHLSSEVDETQVHQTAVWERMVRYCGLDTELDHTPVVVEQVATVANRIGLICGTENSPEKRWPVAHWRALLQQLIAVRPDVEIVLYGTVADRSITDSVCEGWAPKQVRNRAGETNLAEFCDELSACAVVACNDTGGMHLANMLGTPVVAVFGPTNPVRTGPIFTTPHSILQPEGCPLTGGMDIEHVSVDRCLAAVLEHLPKTV
ncbi:glycosyltransferase family 9 protein [Thalassobacterium sedimentorum]|uniref:LpxL/LpxP family acyltransferase n=1 Tax=Thalassobacterium sedimentorum TaxID=3041258 RepID=UPI0028125C9B|nr:glycosyltransferase family 9 protein [Coraliomargarita sp. SDUM461004]